MGSCTPSANWRKPRSRFPLTDRVLAGNLHHRAAIDYATTTAESVAAAVADAIATSDGLVAASVAVTGPRTWDNTLAPPSTASAP